MKQTLILKLILSLISKINTIISITGTAVCGTVNMHKSYVSTMSNDSSAHTVLNFLLNKLKCFKQKYMKDTSLKSLIQLVPEHLENIDLNQDQTPLILLISAKIINPVIIPRSRWLSRFPVSCDIANISSNFHQNPFMTLSYFANKQQQKKKKYI